MKIMTCERCGGDSFIEQDGYRICRYCKSKFLITNEDVSHPASSIALNDDVQRLLRMCHDDPVNVRRYATLILDIDPSNEEATKYLRSK